MFPLLLSAILLASAAAPQELLLDRLSVIAVYTPESEISEAERDEDGFADFVDDFEHYRRAIEDELRDNPKVFVASSPARRIAFKAAGIAPIPRESLSGYGFIVYAPGHAPVVFRGVATEDEVVCALKKLAPDAGITRVCP